MTFLGVNSLASLLIKTLMLSSQGPAFMTSLTLNYFLAPHTATLGGLRAAWSSEGVGRGHTHPVHNVQDGERRHLS